MASSQQPIRVVCLGSGWSTLFASRALRGAVRRGLVDVTVVGRDNFHTFHGFIAEMLVGRIQPSQIITPTRRLIAPARFHNAEVLAVDLEAREVVTARLLDGREYRLPWDHLVVGLGSRDDTTRVPGVAEHALLLRSYWDALAARNRLIHALEMAEIEPDPAERRRLLTFVVAGGGYGGVEVATEIEDYVRHAARREYPGIDPREARVVLVHSGAQLLPELLPRHAPLVRWAERYVRARGIELRLGRRLAAATSQEAVLDDGERIPARTIISSTGMAVPAVVEALPLEKDERGRIRTDTHGRALGRDDVWAAGDCAAVPHPRGGSCPPLALYAMQAGRTVGRNVARAVEGRAPEPFAFDAFGDACSLGRRRAVAHVRGIPLRGVVAWLVWRLFLLAYMPAWDRRLRLLLDWLIVPLTGREVVQMQVGEPVGIRRELYEPGQDVVRQGDPGSRLFLVIEGALDVVRQEADGTESTLATLGPGDHFGELAVFQGARRTATVRARTRARLLAVGRQDAVALSGTLRAFGDEVRALPGAGRTP